MKTVEGIYNYAVIYTDVVEESALSQIKMLCDQEFTKGLKLRIMPDVHAGAGCTIGTTMTIQDAVVPNLVGVDIGCGMETVLIKNSHLELQKLDKLIYEKIPSGFQIRKEPHRFNERIDLSRLRCCKKANLNLGREACSLGTLGGGNHFIEVDRDEQGRLYLVVHSGSRHLGLLAAQYYQGQAIIQQQEKDIPKSLAYLTGGLLDDYIHDMKLIQEFAMLNRQAIVDEIVKGMKLKVQDTFTTIHNYIDTDAMILRKGAVSAGKGEMLLIPINMRDGSLLCIGKGNEDWNYSAPHGAGRLMSRKDAKNTFTVSEFKKQMKEVYTTSVNPETLDECPMAYKGMEDILANIKDTAEVKAVIRPVYNFKAGEEN